MSPICQAFFFAVISIGISAASQGNVHKDLDSAMPWAVPRNPHSRKPARVAVPGSIVNDITGGEPVRMAPELMVPGGLKALIKRADGDPKLQNQAVDYYNFGKKLRRHLKGIYGEMWAEKNPRLANALMTSPQWLPTWLNRHRFMQQKGDTSEETSPEIPEDDDGVPLMNEASPSGVYPSRSGDQAKMSQGSIESRVGQDDWEGVQMRVANQATMGTGRQHAQDTVAQDEEYKRIQEEAEAMQESADTLEGLVPDINEGAPSVTLRSQEPLEDISNVELQEEDFLDTSTSA